MKTHGLSHTAEFRTWRSLRKRCKDKKSINYKYYAARGITYCREWESFEVFLNDMGLKPFPDAQIERIDNNKGYFPNNCKWADRFEQQNNTRKNHVIEINGTKRNLCQWIEIIGINRYTYIGRIKRGWDVIEALCKPVAHKFSHN